MTLRVRDPGGTSRTLADFKVRDPGGASRTITSIKVRDAGNVQREVFAGGAPPSSGINPTISPADSSTSGTFVCRNGVFTVSYTGVATAFAWGSSDGNAIVVGGQGTNTATFQICDDNGSGIFDQVYCDVTVGAATARAYATMSHLRTGGTPGGGGGGFGGGGGGEGQ